MNEKESQVTDEAIYRSRRRFVAGLSAVGAAAWLGSRYGGAPKNQARKDNASFGRVKDETAQIAPMPPTPTPQPPPPPVPNQFLLEPIGKAKRTVTTDEAVTPLSIATEYNNFYEFGTAKEDPARYAHRLTVDPWSIVIDGLCHKGGTYDLETLVGLSGGLEERMYRLRCVEAWSMVIPWIGFPLARLIDHVEPMTSARYVAFQTLYRPEEMPQQKSLFATIRYPYVEGLRMDEARHPLTFFTVGMYGERLYPQNGAPVKVVIPWKYGFKSPKSVVRITFTEEQPPSTWNIAAPREYGFYSNVNPNRSHPRWSQRSERRFISRVGFQNTQRIPTQMFNGYGEQVAHLYKGMDLIHRFY